MFFSEKDMILIAGRKMGSKANGDATLRKEGAGRPVGRPFLRYGTGSKPLPPHGWHFDSRRRASHSPFRGPYLRNASSAYCEQVGVNRHDGGVKGEMQSW